MLYASPEQNDRKEENTMKNLQTGKNELKEYTKRSGMDLIKGMQETRQKRVMGVLIQRQSDALDVLDCVQAQTGMPYDPMEKENRGRLQMILTSPIMTMLSTLGALVFTFLAALNAQHASAEAIPASHRYWLLILLFVLLILGQAVFRLVLSIKTRAKRSAMPAPEVQVLLDVDKARVQTEKRLSRLMTDSEAICGMFDGQYLEGANAYQDELVKLYASLYEAKVDRPDCAEMNYSLTLAEMLLRQLGLKTVIYSEEKKALFNVEKEDYPNQMRFPAIVLEKTGEVVKKGEYIQNTRVF